MTTTTTTSSSLCAALVLTACVSLTSSASFAQAPPREDAYHVFERARVPGPTAGSVPRVFGLGALLTSRALELTQEPVAAAEFASLAADLIPELQDILHTHAALLLVSTSTRDAQALQALQRLHDRGWTTRDIPDAAYAQAKALFALEDHAPPLAILERAVQGSATRADTCAWLPELINPAGSRTYEDLARGIPRAQLGTLRQLLDLDHAHCSGPEWRSLSWRLKAPISPPARLARSGLMLRQVRFFYTLEELDALDMTTLSPAARCTALFRRARATYRIVKMRRAGKADRAYDASRRACEAADHARYHASSLYALGKRAYETGRPADAKRHFEQLLTKRPGARTADDALLYLARIARDAKDARAARALMRRALVEYPTGDMTHEIVWEALEPIFRQSPKPDAAKAYLEALRALTLPAHDDNYLSQGRLEYFAGRAAVTLKDRELARRSFESAWQRYPFSFYGYLSMLMLQAAGLDTALEERDSADTSWLFDHAFRRTPGALLASAGLFDWAERVERARQASMSVKPTEADLWRLAYLAHRAEHYPVSHNIARRNIPGRPWAKPPRGRTVRWVIAWPNPFRALIEESLRQERAQHPAVSFPDELPMAIMREESSFIPTIESYAGALGLMQLMPRTARGHDADIDGDATPERLRTPEVNVRVAIDHLVHLAARHGGHPVLMTAAYNAGSGNVRKWLRAAKTTDVALWVEDIPYDQARHYTKRVLGSYLAYQWLTGRETFDRRPADDVPAP
ncbi:MAG: lytic transglycosylase domain-containing protein [Myxococcota bacterium]